MSASNDDLFNALFADAMQHVQPLKQTNKVKAKYKTQHKPIRNDQSPISYANTQENSPTHHANTLQEDNSPWLLRADGIAPETLKKLAHGHYAVEHTLDLHGMTSNQALQALAQLVQQSLQTQQRVLCIIHGRGLHSQDGRPVLKHSVYQWLKSGPMAASILAVTPLANSAGGSCIVLLRRDKRT